MLKCIRNCYILNNLSLAQLMSYEKLFPEPVKWRIYTSQNLNDLTTTWSTVNILSAYWTYGVNKKNILIIQMILDS